MKKAIFLFVAVATGLISFGQSKFESAMADALKQFGESNSPESMTAVSNQFDRIATAEPGEWLPLYYSSMINCILAFQTEEPIAKQALIDNAQLKLDAALKIASSESELFTLQIMIYQALMAVEPMNNGMVYGAKASGSFQTAVTLDPGNPRPYYLQGISVMYTPEQFGGGNAAALPLFAKGVELYNAFVPKSEIYPNWGKDECMKFYQDCQEK